MPAYRASHNQNDDLERQKQVGERYGARQGWAFEVVTDLGSGMNDHKTGLKRLLNAILTDQVGRLVMTHKDRLLRLGAERVFAIGDAKWLPRSREFRSRCGSECLRNVRPIMTATSTR